MARIRTIKPEFFSSADIVSLTPLARLFYVSMWCEADREGRLNWNTKTFKIRYFAADDCDIDSIANEVIDAGLIDIYEVDGKQYAEIPCFKNHQVINNRESESVIPARVKDASTHVQGEGRKEGKEGKGKERKELGNSSAKPPKFDPLDFEFPDCLPIEVWSEWISYRRKRNLTCNEDTIKGQLKNLFAWNDAGHSVTEIIRASIDNGWQGLFEPKAAAHVAPSRKPSTENFATKDYGIGGRL